MKRSSAVSSKAASRGLSLPELLVASFLFSLILAGAVRVVQEGLRYFTVQSIALDIQQQALLAMKWLNDELKDGSRQSLKTYSSPNGLIFGNPKGSNGDITMSHNTIQWRRFIAYYVSEMNDVPVLVRKERALTVPALAPPAVPPTLTPAAFQADDSDPRLVARYVKTLAVDATANPVKVTLNTDYGEGSFSLTIKTEVRLKEEEDYQ